VPESTEPEVKQYNNSYEQAAQQLTDSAVQGLKNGAQRDSCVLYVASGLFAIADSLLRMSDRLSRF
jgi:hypothetical protein